MNDTLIQPGLLVPENPNFEWVTIKGMPYLRDLDEGIGRHRLIDLRIPEFSWLHKRFSEIKLTQEAIKEFAEIWNNLELGQDISLTRWIGEIEVVRKILDGTMEPDLATRFINIRLKDCTSIRLLWNPERTERQIHIVPYLLIGAIWLQVAQEIAGAHVHRKCEAPKCVNWFLIDPHKRGNAQRQRYCSTACARRGQRAAKKGKKK